MQCSQKKNGPSIVIVAGKSRGLINKNIHCPQMLIIMQVLTYTIIHKVAQHYRIRQAGKVRKAKGGNTWAYVKTYEKKKRGSRVREVRQCKLIWLVHSFVHLIHLVVHAQVLLFPCSLGSPGPDLPPEQCRSKDRRFKSFEKRNPAILKIVSLP